MNDAATLLRNSAEFGEGHDIRVDVPNDVVWYEADEGQMRQIVWNLATNGLRAMPDGGRLTLTVSADGGSDVEFRVADEGVGMPLEDLDRLFQPFRSTFARGTGLGLAIVHRIVSDYGGKVRVTSQPTAGTTVTVRLPVPVACAAGFSFEEIYISTFVAYASNMWSVLFLTLPTQPSAVRLRVWRALKTLGCGSMRDGVYVLPASRTALFDPLVTEVRAHGGQASVLELSTSDEAQRAEVLALFDRTEAYGQWRTEAQALAAALPELPETEARRRWRAVSESLQALRRIDYYPGAAAEQAQAELDALRQVLDARFSRGEPVAQAPHGIPRLDLRKFQGRRWATRARPWVDRLACAWLIRRFIDPEARFGNGRKTFSPCQA